MIRTKIFLSGRYVFVLLLVFLLSNLAFALTPEILSVVPDRGANDSPTNITIYGANFEATPRVGLYGGGSYIVGSVNTPDETHDVYVSGNYAYVANKYAGLRVIDVSDPENPSIVGSADTPGNAHGVYVSGNYAYVTDGDLHVIDVSDPENPNVVSSADTPNGAHRVFILGDLAYVTAGKSLQIIDVSDPENLTVLGSVDTPEAARKVFVSGSYAYVGYEPYYIPEDMDEESGFMVIDISDPENPSVVGSVDTPGGAGGVYVSGIYAYVAAEGLQVIDVSDPANPIIVGSADTPGWTCDVDVSGNYAYLTDRVLGLLVIDVYDPENPTIMGSADTLSEENDVYVSGNYVYVAGDNNLYVLRAFDPCTDITVVNSTTLTATVPAGLPVGTYNLHVVNPNGERDVLYNSFLINAGIAQNPDNSHWYQRFDNNITWQDAKAQCEASGGYLATLTSQDENDFVYNNLVIPANNYWLGGTDEVVEGDWRWITGETWSYTNWAPWQPDDAHGGQDYLLFWNTYPNTWDDAGCPGTCSYEFGFICEWDPPPPCKADFNNDHKVDDSDLNIFSFAMGEADCILWPDLCDCDTDGDNDVDGADLGTLAVEFGRTDCP